jgi:hypothetical protein
MNQPMIELPKYKSHKIVHALKIHNIDLDLATGDAVITPAEDGYGPFAVDAEYMGKHKPRIGGYYVVYDDGYKSWSPADAFEKGYVKVDGTHSPLSDLKAALQANEDFAWTWLCNLACIGLDAGATHENANRRAAQFMQNAFGIDVTKCENWKQFESLWAEESSEDDGDPTLEVWMSDWEAAVESGQSNISREEAEKRYDARYGRNRQQNDDC